VQGAGQKGEGGKRDQRGDQRREIGGDQEPEEESGAERQQKPGDRPGAGALAEVEGAAATRHRQAREEGQRRQRVVGQVAEAVAEIVHREFAPERKGGVRKTLPPRRAAYRPGSRRREPGEADCQQWSSSCPEPPAVCLSTTSGASSTIFRARTSAQQRRCGRAMRC
jgi:hypothetical protein